MRLPVPLPLPSQLRAKETFRARLRRKRLLLTLLMLGSLGAGFGVNTYADFTAGTDYTGQQFATSHVQLNGNNQNDTTTLNLTLTNMIPGDTVTKNLDVTNTGDTDLLSYSLTTSSTCASCQTSKLDDGTGSTQLKVWVGRCSVAWSGTNTCTGTETDQVGTFAAPVAIIQTNKTLLPAGNNAFCRSGYSQHGARGNPTCTVTDTDHLQIQVSLPPSGAAGSGADNSLQGLTSKIAFSFSGVQPVGHGF